VANEMELIKKQIRENVQLLIDDNKLNEAMSLIEEYFKIDSENLETYSMKAIIFIMQGNMKEAEKVLKQGLAIDSGNFDLNYNLGYLYEQEEKVNEAVKYYKNALKKCKDENIKADIIAIVEKISSEHDIVVVEDKKKIVFFVKQGMDSFLGDIINGLSDQYEIKKIIVTDYKQIDECMVWADICWFEWCDELVVYGSKLGLAKEKKVICRLHRYEVFTDLPKNVEWENVNKLIIVSEHLKKFLVTAIPNIENKVDIVTIKNGVNLDKFKLKERNVGFNIAYVGYIHSRKNPVLLLQIINKLVKKDKKYKLYVAGQFQDALIELYWNYQVQQMGLQNNVIFQGWQEDINKWLDDKNYIVSASIHESFGYGIAEAMTRGIKPIIHNFLFADGIWEKKYLYNEIDEAIKMITSKNYDSYEYRKFILENYSLDSQVDKIKNILYLLDKQIVKTTDLDMNYLISKYIEFTPYTYKDIDLYNFENCNISIGKIEKINSNFNLVEFIVKNKEEKQLVLQNIWYDTENEKIILPEYILYSKNKDKVKLFINKIISYKLQYNGTIAGFINDNKMLKDIKKNELAYIWERGIPGTQFLPYLGYLKIIERYIFASLFIKNTDEVLEAASGFGYGAAYFSKLCNKVYALDLAKENIEFAGNTYRRDNVEWINGDVTKLPFQDGKFNVYTSFETFEHLSLNLIDSYFKEAVRVLKKNGMMILSTPNREMRKNVKNPFHIKEYDFDELKEILQKYFKNIIYYSVVDFKVEEGVNESAVNIVAVCSNSDINGSKKNDESLISCVKQMLQQNIIYNEIKGLTLIIPTYNRTLILKKDLEKGFKLGNQKKIIIDDFSDDLNSNILKTLSNEKKYGVQNIIFNKENRGVAFALRIGVNKTNTKNIMCCGDDDIILCNNKKIFDNDYKECDSNSYIMIPRYVLNLSDNGEICIGYDRKQFGDLQCLSLLKHIFVSGEMCAFNAGAIFNINDAIIALPEEIFRVAEDYVMLSRILGNNLNKKIKVSENYVYIRRISNNTLSKQVNKTKLSLHLMSLVVSGYYCLKNSLVNLGETKQHIKNRGQLLQNSYGYGNEFADLIINYISNEISLEEFIAVIKRENIINNVTVNNIPLEYTKINKLVKGMR